MFPAESVYRDGRQERAQILAHIRKESLDIYNRIHSISEDAQFVNEVNRAYPDLPLVRKGHVQRKSHRSDGIIQRIYDVGPGIRIQRCCHMYTSYMILCLRAHFA